tara:strand:+ start:287 stop:484 length:198 start_codon:yes stop_codon:yes gene_type:complete
MENKKVVPVGKYNHYKYYDMRKHIYRLNYEEKKMREQENKVADNYYYEYFKNQLWKNHCSSYSGG